MISNEGVELEDRRDGEQHVCMAKLDGGMRCKTNRVAKNKKHLCRRHIAMDAEGGRVARVSNWKHNPQMWGTTTNHLQDLLSLASAWRYFYPKLKQLTPYYSDSYEILDEEGSLHTLEAS